MTVRRVVQLLVCLFATVAVAIAQPKKQPAPTPAKDPAPVPAAGSGSGSAAEPVEEPPGDIEGRDENPNAPKGIGVEVKVEEKAPEKKPTQTGYPIEEAARPIILPAGMAEVAIGPHASFDLDGVGYAGSDLLKARYSITRQFQLGLNYVLGGIYDDPKTTADKVGFHPGKTLGLEGTYLIKDFIGVKLGVPVWIYKPDEMAPGGSAPAVGLTIGVPLKFRFGNKFAIGGMDDFLAIKLSRFAPSYDYEYLNAYRAAANDVNTPSSDGQLKFSAYGVYQRSPKLALIGRVAVTLDDFSAEKTTVGTGAATSIKAGLEYTLKRYLDLGFSLGFEDLDDLGSFGFGTLLAFRI